MYRILLIFLSAVICLTVLCSCNSEAPSKETAATAVETTVTVSVAETKKTTVTSADETEAVTTTVTSIETTAVTPKTTTLPQTTAAPTVTTAPQPTKTHPVTTPSKITAKPVADIKDLCNRSIIVYDGVQNFKHSDKFVLYDFSVSKDVGISRDNTVHPMRMHYGLTAEIKDSYVYFSAYNDYPDICNVSLKSFDITSDTSISNIRISDKTLKLDMSSYENGLYAVNAVWSNNQKASLYIYVNGGDIRLCSAETMTDYELESFKARRNRIDYLLELQKITPENAVDTSNLCYPWLNQIETDLWMDLSDDITEDGWSESRKLFAFHEWMCENLAYDNYKAENGIRSFAQNDSSGKYDTWQSRIGICHDWVNILLTMCRAQGIPCITADSADHTWNLVYINDSWVELDMTLDIRYNVYGEDMTEWVCEDESIYCYKAYGDEFVKNETRKKSEELIVLNGSLWEYDMLYGIVPYGAKDLLDYYEYMAENNM